MLQTSTEISSLGADIRALRKARGLTLSDLADTLGRSVGWLSQVERDLSEPGIDDLRDLAKALDVSISSLFGAGGAPANEAGYVVRAGSRRPIGSREKGLVEELLSPDLTDDFEVVHSTFAPFSKLEVPNQRPTQEVGYILSGKLRVTIDGRSFDLNACDSFRIKGDPYQWENPHPDPCQVIWIISPPIY